MIGEAITLGLMGAPKAENERKSGVLASQFYFLNPTFVQSIVEKPNDPKFANPVIVTEASGQL